MSIARSSASILAKGAGAGSGAGILGVGAAGAGAMAAASSMGKETSRFVVPDGHRAIRLRFKNPILDKETGFPRDKHVLDSGIKWKMIPYLTDTLRLVWVRDRWNDLGPVYFTRGDKEMQTQAKAKWKVDDKAANVYKSSYMVQNGDLVDAVTDICANGLRNVMRTVEEEYLDDEKVITGHVRERCADELMEYGSVLVGIYMHNVGPRDEEITATRIREGLSVFGGFMVNAAAANGHETNGHLAAEHH